MARSGLLRLFSLILIPAPPFAHFAYFVVKHNVIMLISSTTYSNDFWAALIVEELCRNGVQLFMISPGARSAPLIAAVARHPKATAVTHFDERGAGFYALGVIRATNRPAAVIGTSGTAVANYFPAIVEASQDELPLIVLTADRPPELRQSGANQTIDQVKIFGDYVRWQFDLPCPTADIEPSVVLNLIDHAVAQATSPSSGPVHLNCMFREPLITSGLSQQAAATSLASTLEDEAESLRAWRVSEQPFTAFPPTTTALSVTTIDQLAAYVSGATSGLLLVGRLHSVAEKEGVLTLARKLQWPVLPDITSGLRCEDRSDAGIIHYYDQLLLANQPPARIAPDVILHIGGQFTSRRLLDWISHQRPKQFVNLNSGAWPHDPYRQNTMRVSADIAVAAEQLVACIASASPSTSIEWWQSGSARVRRAIDGQQAVAQALGEPLVAKWISEMIPDRSGLFIGSSMAIRAFDMFATPGPKRITIAANRGASGIDGTLATAIGFARGLRAAVTVVLGDLTLLHDLNSLALVAPSEEPITLVVINNDGGRIFSFLSFADPGAEFERHFIAPHGYTFEAAAQMFHWNYRHPTTAVEFAEAYRQASVGHAHTLIEVSIHKDMYTAGYRQMYHAIAAAIADGS